MKKFQLLVAMTFVAAAASAQYTVAPGADAVLNAGKVSDLGFIALDAQSVAKFENQGAKVYDYAPNDMTRWLYIWDGTFAAGDGSYPGVDDQFDGYVSLVVGSAGWSGAGYNVNEGAGVDVSYWNDDTHFHAAYMAPGTAPASIALIIADGKDATGAASAPAKVALGTAFNDNGAIFPAVGPAANNDWQGLDITFGALKKLYPSFDPKATTSWTGNILSFLAGGVAGQTLALDAVYFYQPAGETNGVAVADAEAQWVVTNHTINVANANGIQLYDLSGKLIKEVAGNTLGIDNVATGVYVARSGNAVRKVAVL